MTAGAYIHIGNAVRLRRWSLTGTGGACRIAAKILRPGLRLPDQCRRRRSPAGLMTPVIWRSSPRRSVTNGFPMTKATPKSP
jgi:hypothetical protein